MKVKVLKEFRDVSEDLKLRQEGEAYTCEKERAMNLKAQGYVEVVEEKAVATPRKEEAKAKRK